MVLKENMSQDTREDGKKQTVVAHKKKGYEYLNTSGSERARNIGEARKEYSNFKIEQYEKMGMIMLIMLLVIALSSCKYFGKECYYAISNAEASVGIGSTHVYTYSVSVYYAGKDKLGRTVLKHTGIGSYVSTKEYKVGYVIKGNKAKVWASIPYLN